MANITVKKNDGTTDVVYTAVTPSAGDKSPAVWRNNTVGSAMSHRPDFRVSSRDSGPGTARRVEATYVYPTTAVGTDGRVNVVDKAILTLSFVLPKGMPETDVNEAVSQSMNLLASALNKDTFKSGYAPS
jgi:hypothetical protein